MEIREWPAGHRLFSEGGFHLAFDPPTDEEMPALLLKIEGETVIVLRVKMFDNDEAALAWFAEERKKRSN